MLPVDRHIHQIPAFAPRPFSACKRVFLTRCSQDPTHRDSFIGDGSSLTWQRRSLLLSAAASIPFISSSTAQSAPAPARVAPFCGVTGVPSWAFSIPWEERVVDFGGYKTWVREVGRKKEGGGAGFLGLFGRGPDKSKGQKWPLLVLHGGPGLPSRYLETLELLAGQDRQIIFYDQIGCGRSFLASENRAPPQADISVDMFVEELAAVKEALGLREHHVLGHGWGGILALTALAAAGEEQRALVKSVTLTATPPSYRQLIADRRQKLQQLPEAVRADLSGRASEEARKQAMAKYSQRFVTARLDASCLTAASSGQSSTVNDALTGGDLFQVRGLLADWEAGPHLSKLQQPVLVLRGGSEELSQSSVEQLQGLRPHSITIDTLEGAASYAHIDAWEPYLEAVDAFMNSNDQPSA